MLSKKHFYSKTLYDEIYFPRLVYSFFLEDKIVDSLEIVKETQQRMCDDISKIKEAVYNPDTGLYARLRTLEEDHKSKNKFWIKLSIILRILLPKSAVICFTHHTVGSVHS